jgi:hypothetical protein
MSAFWFHGIIMLIALVADAGEKSEKYQSRCAVGNPAAYNNSGRRGESETTTADAANSASLR